MRFAQTSGGTYAGLISGSGAVEKTGPGSLTLAPAATSGNTYSGGTTFTEGTVAIGTDNALGATTGSLAFNGGTLQLTQSVDLAGTRAVTLNAGGGTIDTQSFSSTLAQPVTGAGALTKAGNGSLLMTGLSTFGGTTRVAAGTLAVGDAAHAGASLAGGGGATVAAGATLGGYGSVSGTVTNNGTIAAANALPAFSAEANGGFTINGALTNAGLVQIGGTGVGNQLVVAGNYVGQNGLLGLNTDMAGDGAASDRLVISGGTGSGSTSLKITNVGGQGAETVANGIEVIQAANGATTEASAFTLAAPIKAGAYSYYLAKGGVSAGTGDNWYLRNTVAPLPSPLASTSPEGTPATDLSGEPIAAAGTPPLPAPGAPGSAPIPLYRVEVPVYAEIPSVARQIGIMQIDTFHDRLGDQSLLTDNGTLPAAWGRVWGSHSVLSQDGAVNPEFDGSIYGM